MRAAVAILLLAGCRQSTSSEASCAAVSDHVLTLMHPLDDYAKAVAFAFRARCEQDSWGAAAKACVLGTSSLDAPKHCRTKLTDTQNGKLDDALTAIEHGRFPAACARYEKLLDKALACELLAAPVRAALKANYEGAKAQFADAPDQREFAAICESAIAGLNLAANECPGW